MEYTTELDDKGRKNVTDMSEREMLEELVVAFRQLADGLESFAANSPMARMMPGLSKMISKR